MPNYRDQRTQMLMQLLPVILAQQEHQQQNALGRAQLEQTGLFHQGEIDHQKALDALGLAQLKQQGEWHQGELANNQAQLAELAKYHAGELAHQDSLIAAQKDSDNNRMNMDVASHLLNNPNISLEKSLPLLAALSPQLGKLAPIWHQGAVDSAVQAQTPAITGMYGQYNQGHDYNKLQEGLKALQGTMSPEVWGNLPWQQLNSQMTQPTPRGGLFGGYVPQAPTDIPSDLQGQFQGLANQEAQQMAASAGQAQKLAEQKKRQQALNYLYDSQHPDAAYAGFNF